MKFETRGIWAIVPVKRFSAAKQRLRSVLSEDERARLAEAMLCDVLVALRPLPEIGRIVVVTADTVAAEIGRSFGALIIEDRLEGGVNAAVEQGLQAVRPQDAPVAIVAADVPFATSGDIARALDGLKRHSIVIARAIADGGTNLLAMQRPNLIEPSFGEQSFARHHELARAAKLSCCVCDVAGLGHDIDRPGDLTIPPGGSLTRTAALFERFKIPERLRRRELVVTE